MSDVQRWLCAHGGKVADLELKAAQGGERSVFAKAPLRRGDELLSVPAALWCTPARLSARAAGRAALAWVSAGVPKALADFPKEHFEILLLALVLLLERHVGSSSPLADYVASLPWSSIGHLPLTWTPTDLAARLQGASPQQGIEAKRAELARVFTSLSSFCSGKGKEVRAEFLAACPDDVILTRAFALVHSRAMNVPSKDEGGRMWNLALMPFADMFNHSPDPEADWDVQASSSSAPRFVAKATRDLAGGVELHYFYRGAASAQAFFATYGFVEGTAAAPTELHPPWFRADGAADQLEALRLASCRSLRRLLSLLRVAVATDEERSRLDAKASPTDAARLPISVRNERAALERLRENLAARARQGQESEAAAEAADAAAAAAAGGADGAAAATKALRAADAAGWVRLARFAAAVLAELAAPRDDRGELTPARLAIVVHRAARTAARGAVVAPTGATNDFIASDSMVVKDIGGAKGRGYYATREIEPGTLLMVEEPFVFDASDDDFAGNAAAHVLGVVSEVELRPSPNAGGADRDGRKAIPWLRGMEGVTSAQAAEAFRIAQNNGFQTSLTDAPEEDPMLLFRRLCIFNHSCLPNCTIYRDERTGTTRVLAIGPVSTGDELTIHYSDELLVLPTQLRQKFILGRFGFECGCPRCRGDDHTGEIIESALARRAPEADEDLGKAYALQSAMHSAHASICRMQTENGVPMGFVYRTFDDWSEALAAVDHALPHIAAFGGTTFWARHHARALKCLALKGLGRDAAEFLTLAEHADAAWRLLPPSCDALQELQARLDALRGRLPAALLPRLEEKVSALHGDGLAGLAADVARLRRWLAAADAIAPPAAALADNVPTSAIAPSAGAAQVPGGLAPAARTEQAAADTAQSADASEPTSPAASGGKRKNKKKGK